jgi:hypothetical protein
MKGLVPLPPVPSWVPWLAALVWLTLLLVAAWVSPPHELGERLVVLVLSTAATVAFAAAGGGLVVQRWQRREWERRTRFIANSLVQEVLSVLRFIGTTSYEIIVGALPEDVQARVHPLRTAFALPLNDQQEEAMDSAGTITVATMLALSDAATEATEHETTLRQRSQAALHEVIRANEALIAEIRGTGGSRLTHPGPDGELEQLAEHDGNQTPSRQSEVEVKPPFEISADLRFEQAITRRNDATLDSLASASDRLHYLISDLAAYVPANAQALLEKSTSLREDLNRAAPQTSPREEATETIAGQRNGRRRRVPTKHAAAEAAVRRAERALIAVQRELVAAEHATSSANAGYSAVAHIVLTLTRVFALLRELDDIYRRRIPDASSGLEVLPYLYSDLMKIEMDRAAAVANGAADVSASVREASALLREMREEKQPRGPTDSP